MKRFRFLIGSWRWAGTGICLASFAGVVLAIDNDGDGMSDVWQQTHTISVGDTDLDPDEDGASNLVENWFRTNPNLNGAPDTEADMFGTPDIVVSGNDVTITWPSEFGVRYRIERTFDLQSWTDISVMVVGDGSLLWLTDQDPFQTGAPLYRVYSLDPLDEDGDLLDAWEEDELGTSDDGNDANGDGIPDGFDSDEDGIDDGTEFTENSDPTSDSSNSTAQIGLTLFTPLEN